MKRVLSMIDNNFLFYFMIFIIFIILNTLLFFLLGSTFKNNRLYIRYKTERMFSSVIQSYLRTGEVVTNDTDVTGFGIFDMESGHFDVRSGRVPDVLNVRRIIDSKDDFIINYSDNTALVIRLYGDNPPGRMMHGRENMRNRIKPGMKPPGSKVILLEISIADIIIWQKLKMTAYFLFPFLTFILFGIFIYIYQKNQKYKSMYQKQKNLAQLGEVSRTLAHEIKNPLGAIKIQTKYLKKLVSDNLIPEVKVIEEETERLNHLTEKIGDFLRDPIGTPEIVDLQTFTQNIISKFSYPVEIESSDMEYNIMFDKQRLRSVIENVIKNAVESSIESGTEKNIEISLRLSDKQVNMIIRDYGIGLDAEISKMFDPFYTTKTKGSGIGLSVADKFMRAVGGKIVINNNVTPGLEIKLVFKGSVS